MNLWQSISLPEAKLLISCARSRIDAKSSSEIEALLAGPIDWAEVLSLAEKNGMAPLLYWHLNARDQVPAEIKEDLRSRFLANSANSLKLTSHLLSVLAFLKGRGIEALALKGPSLAAAAYGNIALRQTSDVDILVRREEALKCASLLTELGYNAHKPTYAILQISSGKACWLGSTAHENTFIHGETKVHVDLHWDLQPMFLWLAPPAQSVWTRVASTSVCDVEVPRLSPADSLIFLCIHAAKDRFGRLSWICDIAELIGATPSLDWNDALRQAEAMHARRILLLGVYLARDLQNLTLPPELDRAIDADRSLTWLAAEVKRWLFRSRWKTGSNLVSRLRFSLNMRDKRRHGFGNWIYLFRNLIVDG